MLLQRHSHRLTTHKQRVQDGYAVQLEEGVYYVRGQFVRCAKQRLVLSTNSRSVTARVGFTITESLTTPETDTSLTDNATGSSNFAAKGAHRLKITLTLSQKSTTATDDSDFVELMRIENGTEVDGTRVTEYDVLEIHLQEELLMRVVLIQLDLLHLI